LPCCGECNRIAGTQHPYNFTDRYEYVNRELRRKYKRQLKIEDWEDKELAEVSYRLRIYILKWQKIKEWLRKRVAWNVIAYLSSIDHNRHFVETPVEQNIITEKEKSLFRRPKEDLPIKIKIKIKQQFKKVVENKILFCVKCEKECINVLKSGKLNYCSKQCYIDGHRKYFGIVKSLLLFSKLDRT
jgi:hypothetical protein